MTQADALSRLRILEPRLRALGASSLYLFGSTVRDEATVSSDLDLFIDVDPTSCFSLFELVRAKHMVEDELKLSVDLGTRDGLHPRLRSSIEDEAIRVF